MRIRTKRRRLLHILKIIVIFSCLASAYFIIRSFSKTEVKSIITNLKPKIYIVENEFDSFNIMKNFAINNSISHQSGLFISFNSHCNDGLYYQWHRNNATIINMSDILMNLKYTPMQNIYPAIAEYFDKIMCIYPWWRHSNEIYVHHLSYIGISSNKLCLCTVANNLTSSSNETKCSMIINKSEIYIKPADCQPFGRQWNDFFVEDVYAQTLSKDMISDDQIVLNINLDFFIVDLQNHLSNNNIIKLLETQINVLLCPINLQQEISVDKWFQKILNVTNLTSAKDVSILMNDYKLPICAEKESINNFRLKSLLSTIITLSKNQRHQLSEFGLCFQTTLNDHSKHNIFYVTICSGQMSKEESFFRNNHISGEAEITLQMEKLNHFLNQSITKPHSITIVRSTRLGLVSPKSQNMIESLILKQLYQLYHLNETDLVFHPNLLGGSRGWFQREMFY